MILWLEADGITPETVKTETIDQADYKPAVAVYVKAHGYFWFKDNQYKEGAIGNILRHSRLICRRNFFNKTVGCRQFSK